MPEQELGPLGVVRPERERVLVLRRRDRDSCSDANARSPAVAQGEARALDDLVVAATRRADELERRAPVVREHLGVVLGTAEAVDPLGDGPVLRARSARGIWPYDDVADERVRERELALAFE